MSDFKDLKAALDVATPSVDATHKADALALAMKNFDRAQENTQGTADAARLTSERPKKGVIRGVLTMFVTRNPKAILAATTALAAVGLVAVLPVLQSGPPPAPISAPSISENIPSGLGALSGPQVEAEADAEVSATAPVLLDAPAASMRAPKAPNAPMPLSASRAPSTMRSNAPAPNAPSPNAAVAPQMSFGADVAGRAGMTFPDRPQTRVPDTEAFPEAEATPLRITAEDPVSTFSIDVDTASWSVIRNSLNRGQLPPRGAVRIEEMVNYFSYAYPAPTGDAPFATHVGVSDSPWREGTQIVQIGLQGRDVTERPALNLVFLIDTSGSMDQPNKLPLLKQSFRLMLGQLSPEDSVAIVTYAGSAGRVLDPTPASERDTILAALDRLQAGGGTAGQAGLQQAYATARDMAQDGEVSRVILATDGDFNIGISDPDALEDFIAKERDSGTYLSVLGFGRGNLDDATMQALAQTGNGMAAYIDTLAEAQKVLVDQLQGALFPIADDVKIQVEWNPAQVAEYRLIGYETRALRREDFNNDRVDAGEIGAGHQVTALYEITPVGSPARLTEPLRYGASDVGASGGDELGFLRLRYKAPGEDVSQLIETPVVAGAAPLEGADWAMAIAGFGQILRGSELIGDWSMGDAIALAQGARGDDRFGYRQEAITLMRLAQSLRQ